MHVGDHLRLTGFVPPAAEAQQILCICSREWKKFLPFFLPKLQILHTSCVLQISIWHFLVLSCILHFKMKTQNVANHTEPYSTFSIYMNASHMPHSMRNIKQLHSSLFHNSYPAAWFPGVVALLYGNRRRRLLAQAIRFAENRLKHQTASDHTDSCCLLGGY